MTTNSKKRFLIFLAAFMVVSARLFSQTIAESQHKSYSEIVKEATRDKKMFNHMDLSFTAGTTGLGFDMAMPAGEFFKLRVGGAFMPRFSYKMKFDIQVGDDPEQSASRFETLSGYMKQMTGYAVDDHVDMVGKPTINNFKLMLDVLPLRNKYFHISVGLFAGPSMVAKATNAVEDMTSLMAVSIYNNLYKKVLNEEDIFAGIELPPAINAKILNAGMMGMPVGVFARDMTLKDGRTFKAGDNYMMYPNQDNMVKIKMYANKLKPYLGVGYGGPISKDKRYSLSFDCGFMCWGETPRVLTHEGVDLERDLSSVGSQIKSYVNLVKNLKVYPVLDIRVTRKLF